MNKPVKWVAELSHVREVSLLGTADPAFWKDHLRETGLVPTEKDGRAQVLIIAAAGRFWGMRFQELSFSILASRQTQVPPQDGSYLIRAFNSRRFFAFCERAFFSTPYYHGEVRLSASLPASVHLVAKAEGTFTIAMPPDESMSQREPASVQEDGWEGPVWLPNNRLFFARIRGETRTFPFLARTDALTIKPDPESKVLKTLIESDFVPTEWAIREDATHAKSKTY